jgi:sec-independent protein translocase protein TatC
MDDTTNGGNTPSEHHLPPYLPGDTFDSRVPEVVFPAVLALASAGGGALPPPEDEEADDDDGGMLRMSFMGHLEELRSRIIKAVAGLGVAFLACLVFSLELWKIVQAPGLEALKQVNGRFIAISVTEQFSIIWVWTPLVASLFLAAPWVVYQVWAFIAPGLYQRERRWAVPFIVCTAGLFLAGGCFAYFIAFRYGLTFLFSIGKDAGVESTISIDNYFSTFVNVMLGVSLVFELPVLIFFLTLIKVASPSFLMKHSRYAILGIVILAAIITPTPDFFNLTLFAVPMVLLYFLGVFASYLLVLRRDEQKFPWVPFFQWLGVVVALAAAIMGIAINRYGYHLQLGWPLLTK